ncbi:MAG: fimbrillin family protein [Bacteroidales bacterium]|nr:fimbrillin family protein [Bacteroidales bacterium]
MKKNFMMGMFALAALAMTSCSMNDVVRQQDNAINFGTYTGRGVQSKSVELTNDNLNNFGVFASYTAEAGFSLSSPFNYMFNQRVEKSSSSWVYSPLKYWPTDKDEMITFFAYAPYATSNNISVVSTNDDTGCPVLRYTLTSANLDVAQDFVTDVLVDETQTVSATDDPDDADRTVSFEFRHELTRIAFGAKLDRTAWDNTKDNKTQINIKEITFGGTNLITEADYTFGVTDHARGAWSNPTIGTLDMAKLLDATTPDVNELGDYNTAGVRLKNESEVSLFGANDYLFLIPMNGESGIDSHNVTFTIVYDIVTLDTSLDGNYSVTEATKVITVPKDYLKQGVAYKFNLTFYLNEVVFDATVDKWATEEINDNVGCNDQDA